MKRLIKKTGCISNEKVDQKTGCMYVSCISNVGLIKLELIMTFSKIFNPD